MSSFRSGLVKSRSARLRHYLEFLLRIFPCLALFFDKLCLALCGDALDIIGGVVENLKIRGFTSAIGRLPILITLKLHSSHFTDYNPLYIIII